MLAGKQYFSSEDSASNATEEAKLPRSLLIRGVWGEESRGIHWVMWRYRRNYLCAKIDC